MAMTTTGRAGLLLCAASIAIALSGCGSPAPPTLLRAGDDGSAVAVRVGDVLTVRLGSNLTTGHRWRLRDAGDGVLEATGWRYEPAPSPPLGAGGEEVWRFTALRAGSTRLILEYVAADGETVAGSFAVSVSVSG